MIVSYICGLEVLIPTLIAVIYGFAVILKRYRVLYCSMGVLALLCLLAGEISDIAVIFTGHPEALEFHIGTLGSVGCGLFFLTSNVGAVNLLSDSDRPEVRKYNWLANIGPVLNVLFYGLCVLAMRSQDNYVGLISGSLLTVLTMLPLYFSTKFAIIPDTEGGFIACMRPYNWAVTVLELVTTVERGIHNLSFEPSGAAFILVVILYALMGLSALATAICLKKGVEKWRII